MILTTSILNELQAEAQVMLEDIGLTVPNYSYKINNAKNYAGVCDYRKRTIYMSEYVAQFRDESSALNTMVHEMLHAICPNSGHTGKWKTLARTVSIQYDMEIKRCYTPSKEQQEEAKERRKASKNSYSIKCECGFEQIATRKTKIVKTVLGESGGYSSIRCPICKCKEKFSVEKC